MVSLHQQINSKCWGLADQQSINHGGAIAYPVCIAVVTYHATVSKLPGVAGRGEVETPLMPSLHVPPVYEAVRRLNQQCTYRHRQQTCALAFRA